jgi:hypothetical protein
MMTEIDPCDVASLTADAKFYVVLVTQPLVRIHKDSFVMITTSPMRAIALRNQALTARCDMRDKLPYLYPEFVAGPFHFFPTAACYADELVVGRRGLPSKIRHGRALAERFHVPCYHINVMPAEGSLAYLRSINAPAAYIEMCLQFDEAARVIAAHAVTSGLE